MLILEITAEAFRFVEIKDVQSGVSVSMTTEEAALLMFALRRRISYMTLMAGQVARNPLILHSKDRTVQLRREDDRESVVGWAHYMKEVSNVF